VVFDGWTRTVMLRELGVLYTAAPRAEDAAHEPLTWQCADYAAAFARAFQPRRHRWRHLPGLPA
jgi:hypothetical protein